MGLIHEGVYGDHSTDGWLEWGLEEHFAQRRAAGAYTPASNELAFVPNWRRLGRVQRADGLVQKAGLLAAAEARLKGYEINGWESEEADAEYRSFFDPKTLGYAAMIALTEARTEGLEIVGWEQGAEQTT